MTLLVYKIQKYIDLRYRLLKASIMHQFFQEIAYPFNNILSVMSTTVFNIVQIIFINVLFTQTSTLAGLNANEFFFFKFIGQIFYYLFFYFISIPIRYFNDAVHSGSFDIILSKPVPSLFYTMTSHINLYKLSIEALPTLFILSTQLNYSRLSISLIDILAGSIVFVFGFFIIYFFNISIATNVFSTGNSESLIKLSEANQLSITTEIPLNAWSKNLQFIFLTILPIGFVTSFSTFVFLNKIKNIYSLIVIPVFIIFFILSNYFWNKGLKNYTSASS